MSLLNLLIATVSGSEDAIQISTQEQFDALTFSTGQNILFEKGATFYNSGKTIAANVSINSFGTGADPIIHSRKSLIGAWVNDSGNLWKISLDDTLKWVFLDGVPAQIAQIETEVNTVPSATTLTVTDAIPVDLVGATVMPQRYKFRFESQNTCTDSTAGTLTLNGNHLLDQGGTNYSCVIFNHPNLLTSDNEWYYDDTLNELWVYSTTDPNAKDFTYTTTSHAFTLNGNNITIENIEIQGSFNSGLYGDTIDNLNCLNTTFKNIRGDAVHITGLCNSINVNYNTFENVENNGIVLNGWQNSNINNNNASNIGRGLTKPIYWNYPEVYKTGGCFIAECGNNFTFDTLHIPDTINHNSNIVSGTSYMSILMVGDNHICRLNTVDDINSFFRDGGALYGWGNYPVYPGVTCDNLLMENNRVTVLNNSSVNPSVRGIYFDAGVSNSVCQNNTVYYANGDGTGVIFDNTGEINNTFINNTLIKGTPP